jgi:lipopolysaccharide export system permease protein
VILQRYLIREVVQSVASVLAVLLLIYSSHRFVRFLTEAAIGRTSTELLFQMLALKLVSNLALLVPPALFLGSIFALGRLHRDSEVTAMFAGGVSSRTLTGAMLWLSLGVALLTSVLSMYVSPVVSSRYEVVRTRAKEGYQVTGILPGRFRNFGSGEKVVYAGGASEDKQSLEDVFVHVRPDEGGAEELLVSQRAYQSVLGRDGDRFIVLEDGHRYAGTPGEADYTVTRFRRHAVRLDAVGPARDTGRVDTTGTLELWRSDQPQAMAELQWRASLPLTAVVLGVMAVPLSRSAPGRGRYASFFVAVLIYFLYNNAVGIAQNLVEQGELHPAIGVWPVHLAVAAGAVAMIFHESTSGWRFRARLWSLRGRR